MNRHERRRAASLTKEVTTSASPRERVLSFIQAFHDAPNDADIEIRGGQSAVDSTPAILISISGSGDHVLMLHEARKVAEVMEDAMRAHPEDPEGKTLPNMIMALRAACDKAASSAKPL